MYFSGTTCQGYWSTPGAEPTTLIPVDRIFRISAIASGKRTSPIAQYTTHSGAVASTASISPVAATPILVDNLANSPAFLTILLTWRRAAAHRSSDWRKRPARMSNSEPDSGEALEMIAVLSHVAHLVGRSDTIWAP